MDQPERQTMPTAAEPTGTAPSPSDQATQLLAQLHGRPLFVFLDYDGTLAPIASKPDLAVLPRGTRHVLAKLARRWPTAVISGRALADARRLVGLQDLFYAGNHGLEIEGPAGSGIRRSLGESYRDDVTGAADLVGRALAHVPGVLVENKVYSVSVHYRLVADADVPAVAAAVEDALASYPRLTRHDGKMVFELRPALDWNKGRAVLWLREVLGGENGDAVTVYIGDDVKDEDAFEALAGVGLGVLVSETERPTAAAWRLQNPEEVREFLAGLAEAPSA
jgi:trehalose-phosphatase